MAFVKVPNQIETPPSSEQVPGQGSDGQLPPPGGEPDLSSQGPPGAKKLPPPPLLPQEETEEQGSSQPDQNHVPDANLPGPPDVHNMNADPNSIHKPPALPVRI